MLIVFSVEGDYSINLNPGDRHEFTVSPGFYLSVTNPRGITGSFMISD